MFSTSQDLLNLFPPTLVKDVGNGEFHSPCPFCSDEPGKVTEHHGRRFIGDDRFIWFTNGGCYCRKEKRYYSYAAIADRLAPGQPISDDLKVEFTREIQQRAVVLQGDDRVAETHAAIDRGYWRALGWHDTTLDRFQLGYGPMYRHSTRESRHLIPFQPWTTSGPVVDADGQRWAFEGRRGQKQRDGKDNIKTAGLGGNQYFWLIEDDRSSDVLCVTEGLKDAISAWQFGFRNCLALFGATAFDSRFLDYVLNRGYKTLWLFGDADDAGQKFNRTIKQAAQDIDLDLPVYAFQHPQGAPPGSDLSDFLLVAASQPDRVRERMLWLSYIPRTGFNPNYSLIDPTYEVARRESAGDYLAVRAQLPSVIDDYLDHYPNRHRSDPAVVKLLAAPPGVGKTHALIRAAEDRARAAQAVYVVEHDTLAAAIDRRRDELSAATDPDLQREIGDWIAKAERRLARMSQAHVLYVGPFKSGWEDLLAAGADPTLWYNYQARNAENCEMLAQPRPEVDLNDLAAKGYNIREYCIKRCPFAARCRQEGYLAQDEERKQKPILYARHQNLAHAAMVEEYKIVIVDENPLAVFDEPLFVTAADLAPLEPDLWQEYVDQPDSIPVLLEFIRALRLLLAGADPRAGVLSGAAFLSRLDSELRGTLGETLKHLDDQLLDSYQPDDLRGVENFRAVPVRSVPLIVRLIRQEWDRYRSGKALYNTRIHQVGDQLELYPLDRIQIPRNRPIIVADGTAMAELYGLLFEREVSSYDPVIASDQAKVEVLYGSDYTRTHIRRQTGLGVEDYLRYLHEQRATIDDVFGETMDLESIEFSEDLYNSPTLKQALELLKLYAERHATLLFVTHKPLRIVLQNRMKGLYPDLYQRIAFEHYGNLRGTNRYKDYEAVFVLGCPRIPYDRLHRRAMAWAALDPALPYIPPEVVEVVSPYHGRRECHTHPTLATPFGAQFVDMLESGEVRQCVDRIRLYSSDRPKYAYIGMSRPVADWVSSVESGRKTADFAGQGKRAEVLTWMLDWYRVHKTMPSLRKTMEACHVSQGIVQEVRKLALKQLGVTV